MRIAGTLEQVGQGRLVAAGHIRRSMLRIGCCTLYGVRIPKLLSPYLLPGCDVAISVQRILWMRFVFAIAIGSRVYHSGEVWTAFGWLAGSALTSIAAGLTVFVSPLFVPLVLLFGGITWQCATAFCATVLFVPLSHMERSLYGGT